MPVRRTTHYARRQRRRVSVASASVGCRPCMARVGVCIFAACLLGLLVTPALAATVVGAVEPAVKAKVIVLNAESSAALAADEWESLILARGRTKQDGTFMISDLPVGRVRVAIIAEGYCPGTSAPVELKGRDQVADVGTIVLTTAGTIRGKLADWEPGVIIAFQRLDRPAEYEITGTRPQEGDFTVALAPGRYRMILWRPGQRAWAAVAEPMVQLDQATMRAVKGVLDAVSLAETNGDFLSLEPLYSPTYGDEPGDREEKLAELRRLHEFRQEQRRRAADEPNALKYHVTRKVLWIERLSEDEISIIVQRLQVFETTQAQGVVVDQRATTERIDLRREGDQWLIAREHGRTGFLFEAVPRVRPKLASIEVQAGEVIDLGSIQNGQTIEEFPGSDASVRDAP